MSYEHAIASEPFRPRLPTASGLTRALACPTSCVLPQVTAPPSPWSESGRALHAYVEAIAKGKTPVEAAELVPEPLRNTALALDTDNWPVDVSAGWRSEVAVEYNLDTDDAQMIDARGRSYGLGTEAQLYGTADLVRVHGSTVYVVDVKTGRGWLPRPSESGQLRFLALAFARVYACESAEVGHLRVDGDGRAWLDLDTLDAFELATVRDQLLEARAAVTARVVAPKEGQWCRYCPAFTVCPAKAALACASVDVDGPLTRETAAAAWQRIKDVRAVLDRMEASIREYAAREPVPLGDGWELTEVETTRETLDPRTVQVVLLNELGPDIAAASVELSATKASLEAALKAHVAAEKAAGRKAAVAPLKRAMLDKVAAAGGIVQEVRREVKERRTKEVQP